MELKNQSIVADGRLTQRSMTLCLETGFPSGCWTEAQPVSLLNYLNIVLLLLQHSPLAIDQRKETASNDGMRVFPQQGCRLLRE